MPNDFFDLKTRDDLQKLVDEGIEEGLTLDYKASPALGRNSDQVNELCKDVSALANSAGGQIIYGVVENRATGKPELIDNGVTDPKVTREWVDQVLSSKVQPRMKGVTVTRIPISATSSAFVITVQPTTTGPHMASDNKYYRRFELRSTPMEDFEVRDVMRRSTTPAPFMRLRLQNGEAQQLFYRPGEELSQILKLYTTLGNESAQPAYHAIFTLYLDDELNLQNPGTYEKMGQVISSEGYHFHMLQYSVQSPPDVPVFKEAVKRLPEIGFDCPSGTRSPYIYMIKTTIQCPGYMEAKYWHLTKDGGRISLDGPFDSQINAGVCY